MTDQLAGHTAIVLEVNGERRPVVFPTHHTLLEVLQEGDTRHFFVRKD